MGKIKKQKYSPFADPVIEEVGLWKYAPYILIFGLALRLLVAISSNWAMRPDEAIQYLEQAHRLVFGYGFVPWEFNLGVRSWLIPAIPAMPLFLTKWLGIDFPEVYIPLINSWNALISMAVPIGMYYYVRRTFSETAGRWALVFGCVWYEFLIFAPHSLAETYAVASLMAAMALGNKASRLFPVGVLLGFVCVFRPSYSILVAIYGIFMLFKLPPRQWLPLIAGGVCSLLLWITVDFLTWGEWSIINYYKLLPLWSGAKIVDPNYQGINLILLLSTSAGLYPIIIAAAIFKLQLRGWRLFLLLGASTVDIFIVAGSEYTNSFIVMPMIWMLAAVVAAETRLPKEILKKLPSAIAERLPRAGVCIVLVVVGVSILGVLNRLPYVRGNTFGGGVEGRPLIFLLTPAYKVTTDVREMLRVPGNEHSNAIFWHAVDDALAMGGYYQLHRNVPLFFRHDFQHRKLTNHFPPQQLFSHVVALQQPAGFYPAPRTPLFRNEIEISWEPAYSYNIRGGFYVNMLQKNAFDTGVELPPLNPNLFNPDIK